MRVVRVAIGLGLMLLCQPAQSSCSGRCGWHFDVLSVTLVSGDPTATAPSWTDEDPVVSLDYDSEPYLIEFGDMVWSVQ